jgi:hypothetical protein
MDEAERRVARACISMGGQELIPLMLIGVLLFILFLFIEFFSSLFRYNEEE